MSKELLFNNEARYRMKLGIDELADAVKVTLGPKGRNVIINRISDIPHITKDGVTVAKEIEFSDPFKNTGAQLIKSVALKTGDDVGDGTTTSSVLAQAIVSEGIKNLTAGANPIDLKRGIDKAVSVVVDYIKHNSIQICKDFNKIKEIATISANNDPIIGELIANAMKDVGDDGIITIEESTGVETYYNVIEGMQFNNGYLSSYFVTDQSSMEFIQENTFILICKDKITNINKLVPILDFISSNNGSLLIISSGIDLEVLNTLVINRLKLQLKICVVQAPGFGDNRKEKLYDIASLTDSVVVDEERGYSINDIDKTWLGIAEKIIVTKDNTTIVNKTDSELFNNRISYIKHQISLDSENNKEILQERLSKLTGGVAVLYVGAASEVEMKEKKDRVDDALCATRAAIEEGFVAGGGSVYVKAIDELEYSVRGDNFDENTGISIIEKALEIPLKQIVSNSGKEGSVIVSKLKDLMYEDREFYKFYGYNAKTDQFQDLVLNGVIDPAKVVRVALENAASVAGMFLTTECVIVDNIN